MDQPTKSRIKTNTSEPMPLIIYKPKIEADNVNIQGEESVKKGYYKVLNGDEFMNTLIGKK